MHNMTLSCLFFLGLITCKMKQEIVKKKSVKNVPSNMLMSDCTGRSVDRQESVLFLRQIPKTEH